MISSILNKHEQFCLTCPLFVHSWMVKQIYLTHRWDPKHDNKRALHIPQSNRIGASPSVSWVSFARYSLGVSLTPLQRCGCHMSQPTGIDLLIVGFFGFIFLGLASTWHTKFSEFRRPVQTQLLYYITRKIGNLFVLLENLKKQEQVIMFCIFPILFHSVIFLHFSFFLSVFPTHDSKEVQS